MGAPLYRNRTPRTAEEAALMICADFAQECARQGDTANAARWRNVIWERKIQMGTARRVDYVSGSKPWPDKTSQVLLPL